jgi:hypothetical protein
VGTEELDEVARIGALRAKWGLRPQAMTSLNPIRSDSAKEPSCGLSALTNGGLIDVRLRSVQCWASGVASEKKCKCRVTSAWTRHCLCVCLFYAISTSPQKTCAGIHFRVFSTWKQDLTPISRLALLLNTHAP